MMRVYPGKTNTKSQSVHSLVLYITQPLYKIKLNPGFIVKYSRNSDKIVTTEFMGHQTCQMRR